MHAFHEIAQTVRVTAEPLAEPLAVEGLYGQLTLDADSEQDPLIQSLITTARESVEGDTQRALVTQSCQLLLDEFPCEEIELRKPPVVSVESIEYVDSAGELQTLDEDAYLVDTLTEPGRIVPAYGTFWPVTRCQPNAVRVNFTCGYAAPFTANKDTDRLTVTARTFAEDDRVRLSNSGGELPTPLAVLTDYYVVNVSGPTFQLSLTEGGDPINLSDVGSGTNFVGVIPEKALHAIRMLVAHWFRNREAVGSVQVGQQETPQGYQECINRLKWRGGVA